MAHRHTINRDDGTNAHVGDHMFTMKEAELLPGVPSPAGVPCWECGESVQPGENYYMAAIWQAVSSHSSAALIHATHVDVR